MKKKSSCWNCGAVHTEASGLDTEASPVNGDVSLCIRCGEWGVFDDTVRENVRQPTDAEFVDIGENVMCRNARWAWVQVQENLNE